MSRVSDLFERFVRCTLETTWTDEAPPGVVRAALEGALLDVSRRLNRAHTQARALLTSPGYINDPEFAAVFSAENKGSPADYIHGYADALSDVYKALQRGRSP